MDGFHGAERLGLSGQRNLLGSGARPRRWMAHAGHGSSPRRTDPYDLACFIPRRTSHARVIRNAI